MRRCLPCIVASWFIAPAGAAGPDDHETLDALGDLSIEQLVELEVTSVSRRPERLAETPSAIQVITGEDIGRSGAASIPEALRLASNLNVAQQNSHEWVISARGFSSDVGNKLLVLMDGRSLYTPLFSGVFWDRQDYLLADIDRIEVISGPGGSLWGANAVNGVISIITRSARDTQGLYVEGGGGTALQGFGSARYGGRLGPDTYYRIYGKYFERGDEILADGSDGRDSWHMGQAGFRLDAAPTQRDTLTLQGDYYGNEADILTGGRADTRGGNVLGRWTRTFGTDSDMTLQAYYDRTELSLPTPAFVVGGLVLAAPGVFRDDLDTVDVDFQHRFTLQDRHHVVWGLGYRYTHDKVGNAPALGFHPTRLQQDLYSAFLQDEITLVPERVQLTIGAKVEHTDYTGLEFEPSARLQWQITDRHMFWSAVSRAVRAPSRIDREISQPSAPNFIILLEGGRDFRSETVIAYELGYRMQVGEKAAVSIASFYNEYDDIRSTGLTPVTILPLVFENNIEGETYGLELSVSYQPLPWWRLRFGYNFLEEDLRVKKGKFDFNNALNEVADPKNQFSLHSSMDLPNGFALDGGLRWVDRLPTNNAGVLTHVPAYAELDLRLGWRPSEGVELSVAARNLLHDDHAEFGVPTPGSEHIERSVYGKVSWEF